MYREKKHQVENRIVSISQPWIRPIVRGKANAAVEFGAKVSISMKDGYAAMEKLEWDGYNESTTLTESAESYRQKKGCYPARILADKIYRTRSNLIYCRKNGIEMNGPKLGRPLKDKKLYQGQCLQEKKEAGERNAVEGKFGKYDFQAVFYKQRGAEKRMGQCFSNPYIIFRDINKRLF